jgi:recombination protein RecT
MAREEETIAAAVAKRAKRGKDESELLAYVDEEIRKCRNWYAAMVPSWADAGQLVAIAVMLMHKSPKLAAAAATNVPGLLGCLADCAMMGLIPGKTYHLTFFRNKHNPGVYDIVGMVDYAGEIEQMYRSGGVASVHCNVVRGGPTAHAPDHFRWQPNVMIVPEHVITDDGLGEDEDRGPLRGVYAYARLTTGGVSDVAVLPRGKVMLARAHAQTLDFWGPDWPAEGEHTEVMWKKTGLHRLWNMVPHSAEYVAQVLRAQAEAERLRPAAAIEAAPGGSTVTALPLPGAGEPAAGDDTQQGSGEAGESPGPGSPGATAPRGARPPRPQGRRRTTSAGGEVSGGGGPAPKSAGEAFDAAEPITGKVVGKGEGES